MSRVEFCGTQMLGNIYERKRGGGSPWARGASDHSANPREALQRDASSAAERPARGDRHRPEGPGRSATVLLSHWQCLSRKVGFPSLRKLPAPAAG